MRLYIFPHAGGSVSFYVPFSQAFSPAIKRIAVQYPGRSDRHDVTPITSIPALADDIYKMLRSAETSDAPVVFFGHSMGALVAFEVALKFESAGRPIAALFVSACAAPVGTRYEDFHRRSESELAKMVAEATGMNPELLDERFVATILSTFRSYKAIVGYRCPAGATVSCPIYALVGSEDGIAPPESVLEWADLTTSQFSVRVFPGDHFYVSQNARDLAREVEAVIAGFSSGS
jgi:surfactin synthase thioesterase subunit